MTYDDLGPDFYTSTINADREIRTRIRQLEALGCTVALTPPHNHPTPRPASAAAP